jgi:hypothetical protein
MRFARILLASVAVLVAGCNEGGGSFPAVTAPGPPPTITLFSAGPGVIHDLPGFLQQIQYAIVRDDATSVTNSRIVHIPLSIEDATGAAPTTAGAPLYESRMHQPIVAPDGHTVTLGEFNAVAGTAKVTAINHTTTGFELHLTGLIHNGVYSGWLLIFGPRGIDASLSNLKGVGALGRPDGSQNVFVANGSGEANVSITMPEGKLSVLGRLDDNVFEHSFEFHVVGVYHIDGLTYGPHLGPAGTAVEQFDFAFRR